MNNTAILHIPKSQYAFAYKKDELIIRLRAAKGDLQEVKIIYGVKYDWLAERKTTNMQKNFSDKLFDYYTITLSVPDSRIGYIFVLKSDNNEYFYSEDGVTTSYDHFKCHYNFFQFPYINESDLHKELEWCSSAVVYQIFVERFFRGNQYKDDRYIDSKWNELPSAKSFFGGDINGITEKLDYLCDLGVNCLYLTPIFLSPSNHKYDTVNYYSVDDAFGGNIALKELTEKAHNKGVKILLDAVFNHCSDSFEFFKDVVKNGKGSKYYDWFIIKGDYPSSKEENYECFAHCQYMPKLNTNNVKVQDYLINVATHYIKEYEIDGWRLDVSDEVSHVFWKRFAKEVKEINPNAIIIGENWHDARPWLLGDEYDSIMNYSFTKACLDFFAFEKFNAAQFADRLSEILMRNTDQVNNMMLNILDSHDTERFLTNVNEDKSKLKSALAVQFFFAGMPCVYYGTEIGLCGGYDPDSRRTFNWDESVWDKDLLNTVKELISIKKERVSGKIKIFAQNDLFVLKREKATLIVNNTSSDLYFSDEKVNLLVKKNSYQII